MRERGPIRFLLVADTPGHTAGYNVVAHGLRDAGFEVILGGYRLPREIAAIAAEEDVEFIGYRIMDGAPNMLVPRLMECLRDQGLDDLRVVVGGIVPQSQVDFLKDLGVGAVFPPGSNMEDIVGFIKTHRREGA